MLEEYFVKGGFCMWFIMLASIMGMSVFLEKYVYYFLYERSYNKKFKETLINYIQKGEKDKIYAMCKDEKNSVAKMMINIMNEIDLFSSKTMIDQNFLEDSIGVLTLEQNKKLENRMWVVNVTAGSATQLGLLGTVTGLIQSFAGLGSTAADPKVIADGISEALYTTAYGLMVGIPMLVLYHIVMSKIETTAVEMDEIGIHLLKFNSLKTIN